MRQTLKQDRAFYKRILSIAIPIVIQNGISTFVSLLDNIMVGQVGTIPMSGVSIANQLLSVYALCIFGASAGAGIFAAQFYGKGDMEGVRHTFRFRYLICTAIAILGMVVVVLFGEPLMALYLTGEGDPADAALTLQLGKEYLMANLLGFVPFALANAYSGTLRETGKTVVPMVGGISAVLVNLVLNYLLIFGHMGLPEMGVRGAAVATVVSRFVELSIVAGWAHFNTAKVPFFRGVYRSLAIPKNLLVAVSRKCIPLLANEFLWSTGIAVLTQSYSTCGLDVVPALNISGTIQNLSNVVSIALANAIGITMGQMLGSGKSREELQKANGKLLNLSIVCGAVFGVFLLVISNFFPMLYNTTDQVRQLASVLIRVTACFMPLVAYSLATYFTLRSGGQVFITFLFDSCFMWVCPVVLAFFLSRFTDVGIVAMYALCQGVDILKAGLGTWLIRKGVWIKDLTKHI